jgi:Zn-dependent M28 family amino/carboxypeptidase
VEVAQEGVQVTRRQRATRIVRVLAATCFVGLPHAAACAPPEPASAPAFDSTRAFADLAELVALGPRPAGSAASAAARALIGDRLRQAGFRVETQELDVRGPEGRSVRMTNVVGVKGGARPEILLLVTHYDTKAIDGVRFVGANDGASGAAAMLEIARQLGPRQTAHEIRLAFCDGEEAFGPSITADDGLYGSRALAARMEGDGTLARIRALILVDMVADADLNLSGNLEDSPRLRALLQEEAARLGLRGALDRGALPGLIDDHTPFAERGVEQILTLIDFQYGARRTPGPFWHTERDALATVSAESLARAGRLALAVLARIDAAADTGP